jgi:hypothetical protein
VGVPPRWPCETPLSTKVGAKIRWPVAVAQSVQFTCGLKCHWVTFLLFHRRIILHILTYLCHLGVISHDLLSGYLTLIVLMIMYLLILAIWSNLIYSIYFTCLPCFIVFYLLFWHVLYLTCIVDLWNIKLNWIELDWMELNWNLCIENVP